MARLEIIIGGMFSGKSTELIRRIKRHRLITDNILVINSIKDIRCEVNVLQTHDSTTIHCNKTKKLTPLINSTDFNDADIIAVDECQFFNDLTIFVKAAIEKDKHIILAGLDGDFKQDVFGDLIKLIPLADTVDKLNAICMSCKDGTPAPFTKRLCNSTTQELVGATESYVAVCRKHL